MIALWLMTGLLVKHFLADFPLQNQKMVTGKGIYGNPDGLKHSGIHGIMTYLVTALFVPHIWIAVVLGCLDFTIHYNVDWVKTNVTKKLGVTPSDNLFWTLLGADQLVHGLTYIAITALALR